MTVEKSSTARYEVRDQYRYQDIARVNTIRLEAGRKPRVPNEISSMASLDA